MFSAGFDMIRKIFSRIKNNRHGQSFVELMLVVLILMLLLAGIVEFGFLMNEYLHVLDSAREAARFSSASDPIADNGTSIEKFYIRTAIEAIRVLDPIVLDGNKGDDIVISVLSVSGANVVRFPDNDGWSTCAHAGDSVLQSEFATNLGSIVLDEFNANWSSCVPKETSMTTDEVRAMIDPSAPASGILIVEIFYNYSQILGLPVFTNSIYSVIPDPIPVYVYTIMPISAAEPTPTPRP